jgi:hypothetical protein
MESATAFTVTVSSGALYSCSNSAKTPFVSALMYLRRAAGSVLALINSSRENHIYESKSIGVVKSIINKTTNYLHFRFFGHALHDKI